MSSNALLEAIKKIDGVEITAEDFKKSKKEIVDIMTFCESSELLNLPGNNLFLYSIQKIILKSFYMGSRGNENLSLAKEEWEWLYDHKENIKVDDMEFETNIDKVIKKLEEREQDGYVFNELNLVIGRRGTKTMLASIITAYEAYKLLTIGDGDPYLFFKIPYDDEIAIINVSNTQKQSGRLFAQIKNRIRNGPFFSGRIASESQTEVRLLTDADIDKIELKKKDPAAVNLEVKGSVCLVCGHGNPDSLRGYAAVMILFDELAFYDSEGVVNGEFFYESLRPSIKQFKPFGEGRLVEISSPGPTSGIFYKIFDRSHKTKESRFRFPILAYQLPTWLINDTINYEDLELEKDLNPDSFAIEYGAQWPKTGLYGNYFPEGLVDRCVRTDISQHDRPYPGFSYYIHVDPAQSGDRYVAILVAKEMYVNNRGQKRVRVRLANIWSWEPIVGYGLRYAEIDKEMIKICGKYHPMAVSYDQFESGHSLQLLKSHGVNTIRTAYNRNFKNKIYQNLKDMMNYEPEPELWLYDDYRLLLEMKALRFRPTQRGISLVVDKHGAVKTDDVIDCLAGACAMASENIRQPLPKPICVHTGWR